MSGSKFISLLAWCSAIVLAWGVSLGSVKYNGLVLGAFIFFVVVGTGAGLLSISDTVRK
jgi:hypothetical protein